ncbi:hypothetical protein GGTG_03307 [Gaeumannomyces tritici R3-111a-1]|uniref:CsbD-like domain-containing protein n=1 Tax=Gaeumannomyces tritici (strain R3-111a-1) TaxID=644352 RepID=J3NPV0_GAET3|nr:hypothetical protein GGTG_03307 [Gaeumannomyces tritici R3-111a-1]EJT78205.1 hypothetical protein GGTG_03307 [Gaeumannomyces tritici R3-111a-1]
MSTNTNTQSQSQESQQPGLLAGHAEYIKGIAETAVGSVTGSHAWTSSGEQDKAHAVHSMKAAGEQRDPASQGYGKFEEMAGRATGCAGMEKEGAASVKKD